MAGFTPPLTVKRLEESVFGSGIMSRCDSSSDLHAENRALTHPGAHKQLAAH
jgi:hypothetical protein